MAVPLGYAENEIRKKIEEKYQDSKANKKGHETRTHRVLDTDWDAGSEFENNNQRFRERNAAMQALDLWLGTFVTRAVNVLRYIISKQRDTCNQSSLLFDEYCFLSPKIVKQIVVLYAMIKRAHTRIAGTGISGMKRRISKEKLQILTGVVALLVLPQDDSGSYASLCKLLGVN